LQIELASLRAVSRVSRKSFPPTSFDATSGQFEFADLPGDARYDVCFRARDGREVEGVDLDFVDQRLLRLAHLRRRRMGIPDLQEPAFESEDAEELVRWVREMDDFMEQRRVLYVAGQGRRATLLVESMRTRSFHASESDEVIWRVELWYFEKHPGGWDRLANQERLLRRLRTQREPWSTVSLEYYPSLSGYVSAEGESEKMEFTLPAEVDASRGRPPASEPELKTKPHIIAVGEGSPPQAGPARPSLPQADR
jgi:hypothetical protein